MNFENEIEFIIKLLSPRKIHQNLQVRWSNIYMIDLKSLSTIFIVMDSLDSSSTSDSSESSESDDLTGCDIGIL